MDHEWDEVRGKKANRVTISLNLGCDLQKVVLKNRFPLLFEEPGFYNDIE